MAETPELPRPTRFTPHVTPRVGADPTWVDAGQRYWALQGLTGDPDAAPATPVRGVWVEPTDKIAADVGEPASRLYVVAAAAVTATLSEFACSRCGAPLELRSRSSLDALLKGGDPDGECARCSATLARALAQLTDPVAAARRTARREAEAARRGEEAAARQAAAARAAAQRRWDARRRDIVNESYPLQVAGDAGVDWSNLHAPLRVEVAALAMLDYAPAVAPLPPERTWTVPLAAAVEQRVDLLAEVCRSGLLRIHPDSPLDAFEWEPVPNADGTGADGDADPTMGGSWWPSRVVWYAWQGGSVGTSPAVLAAHLERRTAGWRTTRRGQDDLVALTVEVMVSECLRYFDDQLGRYQLPEVPDNHRGRLVDAVRRAAAERPLGALYNLAWRAVRAGAAAAQEHQYAPLERMTTHAVNRFESDANRAATDPEWELRPFDELTNLPLTALTRTVFHKLLGADPMTTTVAQIRAALPTPTAETLPVSLAAEAADGTAADEASGDTSAAATDTAADLDLDLDAFAALMAADPTGWARACTTDDDGERQLTDAWQRLTTMYAGLRASLDEQAAARAVLAAADVWPGTFPVAAPGGGETASAELRLALTGRLFAALRLTSSTPEA